MKDGVTGMKGGGHWDGGWDQERCLSGKVTQQVRLWWELNERCCGNEPH